MSIPALRQPKIENEVQDSPENNLVLTLKDGTKLVTTSDSFNGIITVAEGFKCVLCCANILDVKSKEIHKDLRSHIKMLNKYPHLEEFGCHLIRVLNRNICYCIICNATTPTFRALDHISLDSHVDGVENAIIRANSYEPTDINNNKYQRD